MVTHNPWHGRAWLGVALAVVIADQVTKRWALSELADGRVVDLPGPSRFVLSFNTGIAFGQGQGRGLGPVIAGFGMVAVIVLVTRVASRVGRYGKLAVGLVVGGAVGNLIDRVTQPPGWLRGGVIDFIQAVPWFYVFNVADIAITLGAVGVVLSLAAVDRATSAAAENTADTEEGHGQR